MRWFVSDVLIYRNTSLNMEDKNLFHPDLLMFSGFIYDKEHVLYVSSCDRPKMHHVPL